MGRKIFKTTLWSGIKRSLWVALPFLRKYIRISIVPQEASDFFLKVVKETVQYREENNYTRNDFLQLLIEIKHKGAITDVEEKHRIPAYFEHTEPSEDKVLGLYS